MRNFFLISLFIFATTSATAKCSYTGIYALQPAGSLHANSVFILEFYGKSQELVAGLGEKYHVYLGTRKDRVELVVSEVLQGEFMLTQVIFRPAGLLQTGKKYELKITELPAYDRSPSQFNALKNTWEPISFVIGEKEKNPVLPLITHALETEKSLQHYGCGPAKWVYFNISGQQLMNALARTTVKNLTTGKTTTYILPITGGRVSIGHGMCSGPFLFNDSDKYEVSFAAMDDAGNTSKKTGTLSFSPPTSLNAAS